MVIEEKEHVKSKMNKEDRKKIKKQKQEKMVELKKQHFISRCKRPSEELLYAFGKRFNMKRRMAIAELKRLGYCITPEQMAFSKKKEADKRIRKSLRKEAKYKRKLAKELHAYEQSVIDKFLATQEIADLETWLILKNNDIV